MRAITLAHQPHHSHATTPPHSRIYAYVVTHLHPHSKQGCARSFGVSYPFLRRFTIIGTYLLEKFFKEFVHPLLIIHTNPFNDLYKSFK